MTQEYSPWQREALQAIMDIAGLPQRPSALSRARARVTDVRAASDATLETIASTLREIGVAANVESISSVSPSVTTEVVVMDVEGHVVRMCIEASGIATITRYDGIGASTTTWNAFVGSRDTVEAIVISGTFQSFLTSDDALPHHRGHQLDDSGDYSVSRLRDVWPLMRKILHMEKRDVGVVSVYAILTSLLGLVVPLSSQSIVNAVALGVFSQQLVVLCVVVFCAMMATAVITVLERYIVDMIQRRLFVSTAFDIVYRLPHIKASALKGTYAPELVNRFFDVMTVQKSVGKFLLEGINAVLVLLTGLVVLGIYHPFFLLYDFVFVLFLPVLVLVLGRNAIPNAIKVSGKKYQTASWLEDVARNQLGFKLTGTSAYAFSRIDDISTGYVEAQKRYYLVLARQIFGSYVFKGFATVGILALGGILVLEGSISLGQLVAAEIIIILILGAMEKLIGQFDLYYDLVAALDKLSAITGQPLEDVGGISVPNAPTGGSVIVSEVGFSYDRHQVLSTVSFSVSAGQRVSLVGPSGAGKSTLAHLILGLYTPTSGSIEVNGVDTRVADLRSLRSRVGYIFPDNQIVPGTVLDNITLGRHATTEDLAWAISMAMLEQTVRTLPNGIHTIITTTGENLSYGMRRRILFARMILSKPDVLIIDEAFEGIEDGMKLLILDELMKWPHWTIINISHDPEVVRRTQRVYVLYNGEIIETGTSAELHRNNGPFTSLFPDASHFSHGSSEAGHA